MARPVSSGRTPALQSPGRGNKRLPRHSLVRGTIADESLSSITRLSPGKSGYRTMRFKFLITALTRTWRSLLFGFANGTLSHGRVYLASLPTIERNLRWAVYSARNIFIGSMRTA